MIVEKKFLNASEAADFLDLWRPDFYKDYINNDKIKPVMQTGRIKLYAIADLKRIKAKLHD